jgi:hypothetical protein
LGEGIVSALGRWTCATLAVFVLLTAVAGVAGCHEYQVLVAPPRQPSDLGLALSQADMWFGNLTGWWRAVFVVALLLFVVWLDNMRALANEICPEGQRRHRAWLLFGWFLPVAQLFVPKMFINDLWAAAQPAQRRRRGHPLLTMWWLTVLAAGQWADGFSLLKRATASTARDALHHLVLSEILYIGMAALTLAVVRRLDHMLQAAWGSRAG